MYQYTGKFWHENFGWNLFWNIHYIKFDITVKYLYEIQFLTYRNILVYVSKVPSFVLWSFRRLFSVHFQVQENKIHIFYSRGKGKKCIPKRIRNLVFAWTLLNIF